MTNSNIIMYTSEDGLTRIEVSFVEDTVWLSIDQMAELFQRDRSVVGKHIRNIFKEGKANFWDHWMRRGKLIMAKQAGRCPRLLYLKLFLIFQRWNPL